MKSTDSRECRKLPLGPVEDPRKQSEAGRIIPEAIKNGLTCIDCHKGIPHQRPKEADASDEAEKK